jgi:hypothetical protein
MTDLSQLFLRLYSSPALVSSGGEGSNRPGACAGTIGVVLALGKSSDEKEEEGKEDKFVERWS